MEGNWRGGLDGIGRVCASESKCEKPEIYSSYISEKSLGTLSEKGNNSNFSVKKLHYFFIVYTKCLKISMI